MQSFRTRDCVLLSARLRNLRDISIPPAHPLTPQSMVNCRTMYNVIMYQSMHAWAYLVGERALRLQPEPQIKCITVVVKVGKI